MTHFDWRAIWDALCARDAIHERHTPSSTASRASGRSCEHPGHSCAVRKWQLLKIGALADAQLEDVLRRFVFQSAGNAIVYMCVRNAAAGSKILMQVYLNDFQAAIHLQLALQALPWVAINEGILDNPPRSAHTAKEK